MPAGTLMPTNNQAPAQPNGEGGGIVPNPFVRGAAEIFRKFDDRTVSFTSSAQRQGPISVAPIGYMANLVLLVETDSTGAGGSGAGAGDAPWNVLESVSLEDVAGRQIVSLNGYELFQACKRGGYVGFPNPGSLPSFSDVSANGEFAFSLRVPVQLSGRDALGALPNQSATSTFKLYYSIAAEGTVYTTSPVTTTPAVRVRAFLEAWDQPEDQDPFGIPNEQRPPGPGTTQFWTSTQTNINAGEQRITMPRVGNHLRALILSFYNDSSPSVRNSSEFPTDLRLEYDNQVIFDKPSTVWLDQMYERYGFAADTGVYVIDFAHDLNGVVGNEPRNLWLPTTQGTLLELVGTWTGSGGTLKIATNDVLVRGPQILEAGR